MTPECFARPLVLTPGGHLITDSGAPPQDGALLLALLRSHPDSGAPLEVHYFRRFAREFAARLARHPQSAERPVAELLPELRPTPSELGDWRDSAPPFRGGEYLTTAALQRLYRDLEQSAAAAAGTGSAADWLEQLDPAWRGVGRLCFHLAENRNPQQPERPFLFLATFVHRLSENNQPKHLPLAGALRLFAHEPGALLSILAPLERAAAGSRFVADRLPEQRIFQPEALSAAAAYEFLQEIPRFEEAGIAVRTSNLWQRRPKRLQLQLALELAPDSGAKLGGGALLRFSLRAALGGRELTEPELQQLLSADTGLIRFRGEWVEAESSRIRELLSRWRRAEELQFRHGLPLLEGLRLLAGAGTPALPEFDAMRMSATPVGKLRELLADWEGAGRAPLPPLPPELAGILRNYQLEGVRFLWTLTRQGFGVCLADDMGLGKTLQLLTVLELLRREGALREGPALLVVPASLLENWQNEAARFTPDLRFAILHRAWLGPEEFAGLQENPERTLRRCEVAAVTYQTLLRLPRLAELTFPLVALDEAQAIRNPGSRISRLVRRLRGARRIALTGTPVENHPAELWSLFDFLQPGLLGTLETFRELTGGGDAAERPDYAPLRRLIRPFLLRRLKTDRALLPELPDKTEVDVYCALSAEQAVLYQQAVNELKRELEEADDFRRHGVVLKYLTRFKQICNHPAQYLGTGDYALRSSGKFERLAELAGELAARQERVLIFTQFRELTEPLHELLTGVFGRPGLVLHGATPPRERLRLVERFQAPGGPPFFVLSLKAAGTGLNLTAATQVIHFDRWWNPAVENQATDRAYRLGQHRNVLVHKFITRGTLEQKIARLLADKTEMAESLLGGAEKLLTELSGPELLKLLRLEATAGEEE